MAGYDPRPSNLAGRTDGARVPFAPGPRDLICGPAGPCGPGRLVEVAGGRTVFDFYEDMRGDDWGTFSTRILRRTWRKDDRIHFDLTHVEDREGVLAGTGRWAHTYTAIELRFLAANWAECGDLVTFWDAVAISPDGVYGVMVPPPWGSRIPSTRGRRPPRVTAGARPPGRATRRQEPAP